MTDEAALRALWADDAANDLDAMYPEGRVSQLTMQSMSARTMIRNRLLSYHRGAMDEWETTFLARLTDGTWQHS